MLVPLFMLVAVFTTALPAFVWQPRVVMGVRSVHRCSCQCFQVRVLIFSFGVVVNSLVWLDGVMVFLFFLSMLYL
jgi:hypothetical protein